MSKNTEKEKAIAFRYQLMAMRAYLNEGKYFGYF